MHVCFRCEREIVIETGVGRQHTCPHCHAYLHACRNCRFYEPAAHNHCREPQAEWVPDPESGNFCSFFTYREATSKDTSQAEAARARLEAAFAGRTSASSGAGAVDPRKRLEDLFKKK